MIFCASAEQAKYSSVYRGRCASMNGSAPDGLKYDSNQVSKSTLSPAAAGTVPSRTTMAVRIQTDTADAPVEGIDQAFYSTEGRGSYARGGMGRQAACVSRL